MKILAVDTTGSVAGVALLDENLTIAEFSTNFKQNHSVTLMPLIESLLKSVETDPDRVDYIAVASGPGSFTGLRIGCATAKGLAHGCGKQIIPVPTLDALAYNMFMTEGLVIPIMDARRNQVYTAIYSYENGKQIRLTDYLAEDINNLAETVKRYNKPAVFLGDAIFPYKSVLTEYGFDIAPNHMNMQRAASVASLAFGMTEKAVNYHDFKPFYLRLSQAERLLQENGRESS